MSLEYKSNGGLPTWNTDVVDYSSFSGRDYTTAPWSNDPAKLAAERDDKLFLSTLKINLNLPTGYYFLPSSDGSAISAGGYVAKYRATIVGRESICEGYNSSDGSESSTFSANTDFFKERDLVNQNNRYYRITNNDRSTSAEFIISQPHDVTRSGSTHYAKLLTKSTGVSGSDRFICVEAIYTKTPRSASDDTDYPVIYQYVAKRYIPRESHSTSGATRLPEITSVNFVAPNNPAKIGDVLTIRVNFNRPVKLSSTQYTAPAYRHILPYIYVRSNQAPAGAFGHETAYGDKVWQFNMARVPARATSTLEFHRTVQLGDEITTSRNYQLTPDSLAEDYSSSKMRIHTYGNYYIVDAETGYFPDTRFPTQGTMQAQDSDDPPKYFNNWYGVTQVPAGGLDIPDYFLQIPIGRVQFFKLDIDTLPTISLSRSGRNLIAKATPTTYRTGSTTNDAVVASSWYVRIFTATSTTRRPTTTKCDQDTGDRYRGTITSRASDSDYARGQASITLPATADNKWYCFGTVDTSANGGRAVASSWSRYVADSTAPRLTFNVVDNRATITTADAGSGINTNSFGWFVLDNADATCMAETAATRFTNTEKVITIRPADAENTNHNLWICVRVADNASNVTVQRYQLARTTTPATDTAQTTETVKETVPTEAAEPSATEEAETTTSEATATTGSTGFLPANWGTLTIEQRIAHWSAHQAAFDAAWAALSTAQKIALNPFGCITTQIREDNGRCAGDSEGSVTFTGITGTPSATTAEGVAETTDEEATGEEEEVADGEEATDDATVADEEDATTPATTTTDATTEESSSNTTTIIMIVAAVVVAVIIVAVVMSGRRTSS